MASTEAPANAATEETVARFVDNDVIPLAPELDEAERFPEESFKAMADKEEGQAAA